VLRWGCTDRPDALGFARRTYVDSSAWMIAVAGSASSAPTAPSSVPPMTTDRNAIAGCTSIVLLWIRGAST
jgi:hypothetical protein